jgi:hypothetical protein
VLASLEMLTYNMVASKLSEIISFKGDSVFLEAPVQLPEMLLLPAFDRGEASIVLTIALETRSLVAMLSLKF